MKMRFLATCAVALLSAAPLAAQHQTYTVNPDTSTVSFQLGATGHETKGDFHVTKGTVDFDAKTGSIAGIIVVNAGSGNTGNASRDKKMTTEVLEATKFNEITFAPKSFQGIIAPTGHSTVQVTGTFTLHGTPHEITTPMKLHMDNGACTAETTFTVPYVAWGLKDPSIFILKVAKDVQVMLKLEGKIQ